MRGKIATAAVIGALAITGTAAAAGAGPAGGLLGDDKQEEFAADLAAELDGVNPNQVSEALEQVREQQSEERRAQMAEGIAAELDGVDADAVAEALATHEQQMRQSVEAGEQPDMGSLVTTLAEELGKSEDEIAAALDAAREAGMAEHQAEALERLDEAVANGDITSEQAEEIRERIESGPPEGGPRGHGGPGGPGGMPGGPMGGPGGPPPATEDGSSSGSSQQDGAYYGAPAAPSGVA